MDQYRIATEKVVCYSQCPRPEEMAGYAGTDKDAPRSVKRQKEWEKNVGKGLIVISARRSR